ncbi:hypothetical protein [Mucilaginibacter sp. SJ]|uniref:hypothetical protein n=1 Tax=Mucilaginibacter sp. SJ TaxID=3029053 RepID=UPI0023AA075E|nr:hypothetical protein [Mucilaginibacter sp. SJ]WEA01717.1 hypothetical protein MusilaSJ_02125 [Mucilaginibacter sp. SJ]
MNQEALHGSLVLVHPALTVDPANAQGKVAVVTYDRPDTNEIYVSLMDGKEAVYHPDNLLKLKDRQQIMQTLVNDGKAMPLNDFKTLYKIGTLLDRGTNKATFDALELAAVNPGVWESALSRSRPAIEQKIATAYTR